VINVVGGHGGGAAPLPPIQIKQAQRPTTGVLSAGALVAALLAYPFIDRALGLQTVHAVSDGMIYVLLALGLNIVIGYAGLLDLGYAAFFAIGAYTMGLLNSPVLGSPLYGHPWSFWLCIWLAAAMSALLGLVIGAPTLRVRGDYLAIITLGFGEIIPVAIRNLGDITIDIGGWRPVERLNLTGGENGVNPVGRPYLPGVPFETDPVPWYFLILVIGALSLWAMSRLQDSRLGRAWMAIREDETAADCTGVNPISTKLLAFALGAWFSGFAGSVYAAKLQAITPGAFEFQVSIMLLCMVVLGGAGSLRGVILGGMLITLFDRVVLSQATFLVRGLGRATGITALVGADLTLWRWFFFGLGLAVMMLVRPQGLAGRRLRPVAVETPDADDAIVAEAPPAPIAQVVPVWLREVAVRGGPASAAVRGAAEGEPSREKRSPLLEVRGLSKRFGGVVAVSDVDLVIPRGAIIGLIGPNGAGKTTFFNTVTGLIRPDGGAIVFDGASLVGLRPNAVVARGVARTFQSIRLFQQLTVLENVLVGQHCRLAARVLGAIFRPPAVVAEEARARERGREVIAFVGLAGKEDDIARNLSYGDQRRLEIARALATEPRLLLLDEPSAGMNPRETDTLTELIGLMRRELALSILLIEHHMEVVMGISDRITVLDHGVRIAEGTPAEIQRHSAVIEAYLGTGYEAELAARSR
jgi:branched-chain amino acid transport system permease protein